MTYWESLYRRGGTSGAGSVGALRAWKWQVLENSGADFQHVIDVGCGDLSFWDGRRCGNYLGIEQSKSRVATNWSNRKDMLCIAGNAEDYYHQIPQALQSWGRSMSGATQLSGRVRWSHTTYRSAL